MRRADGYDYVRRMYAVDPIVGDRVQHNETRERGIVAAPSPTHGHYVQVRFDGVDHVSNCHPTALVYYEVSDAAWRLLARLAQGADTAMYPRHKSAFALRTHGFADWDGEAGRGRWWLLITDLGVTVHEARRAVLKEARGHA